MMTISRRELLKWIPAGAAALTAPGAWPQDKTPRKIPLGIQLWSVRDDCAKDFDAALKQVANMGFQGVEFAGYHKYGKDAKGLKKKLDDLGLKSAGTHVGADALSGERLKETVEFHKTLGCSFLIVPGDGRFTDPEKSKEYADFMNKSAEALKADGLSCGHHNHTEEFKKAGGKTYWDLFAERTSKDVILQLDVGHATFAGMNPVDLVKAHPGRTKSTHIKARLPKGTKDKQPFVGQDVTDWKAYVAACRETGGTEWFLIEQEEYPGGKSPMECARTSLEGFKKFLTEK